MQLFLSSGGGKNKHPLLLAFPIFLKFSIFMSFAKEKKTP